MGLVKIGFFVVGRLATAILGALGLASGLTGESVLGLSASNWGIVGLIAFTVFFGLTVAREVDLALEQRPNIVVRPEIHDDRALLVVTNIGGSGSFTAKARAMATTPGSELYTMYWEPISAANCLIDGDGGVASILVAGRAKLGHLDRTAIDRDGDFSTSFLKGDLLLFKIGTRGIESFPAFSGICSKEIRDGREITSGTIADRCIVEVTITATPTLKKKWGTHKYLCEIENGQLKLCETELSVPHQVTYETE